MCFRGFGLPVTSPLPAYGEASSAPTMPGTKSEPAAAPEDAKRKLRRLKLFSGVSFVS